jgi:hypothetical protein
LELWLRREGASRSSYALISTIVASSNALFDRFSLNKLGQESSNKAVTSTIEINDFFFWALNWSEFGDLMM